MLNKSKMWWILVGSHVLISFVFVWLGLAIGQLGAIYLCVAFLGYGEYKERQGRAKQRGGYEHGLKQYWEDIKLITKSSALVEWLAAGVLAGLFVILV